MGRVIVWAGSIFFYQPPRGAIIQLTEYAAQMRQRAGRHVRALATGVSLSCLMSVLLAFFLGK